jgi:hypothetical protein
MKTTSKLLLTAVAALSAVTAFSQGPKVPAKSPGASVKQTFGLTDVSIDYSCPAVNGRTIWGGLVPYDSVWRTGANAATVIDFSTGVMVGGTKVKAGKYALFTIPGKDNWTVILNSEWDQWGSFGYKKSMDVVRFTVKPEMTSDTKDRMAFYLDATSDSTCKVTFRWEKVRFSFDVTAGTNMMVQRGFDNMAGSYANAANYYVDNKLDLNKAEQWAKMSIDIKQSFYNEFIMARVLQAKGNNKDALTHAQEAKKLGEAQNDDFYGEFKARIAKLIDEVGGAKK